MITKILLAYDGSDNASRALDVAAQLCMGLEADLSIVHVLMHGSPAKELIRIAEIEHMVKEVRRQIPDVAVPAHIETYDVLSGVGSHDYTARVITAMGDHLVNNARRSASEKGVKNVSTSVRSGNYALEILNAATEHEADMIVIGSRGLGAIRGRFLGSVSQKILHHAEQTVVTVK